MPETQIKIAGIREALGEFCKTAERRREIREEESPTKEARNKGRRKRFPDTV